MALSEYAGGKQMNKVDVEIYLTRWCPFCHRAKALLDSKQVTYKEIDVDTDPALRRTMEQRSGGRTVPQIFIGGKSIGGCDELYALERQDQLDALLLGDNNVND